MRRTVQRELPKTALRYIIEGLIPYTDANIKLSFRPGLFFQDLEKISGKKARTLQNRYYKAVGDGLIKVNARGAPQISESALQSLRPFQPKQLRNSVLMVVFDIPEGNRWKRDHLRILLRQLKFTQIQRSVWQTKFDSRTYLLAEIKRLDLEGQVLVYEASILME